MSDTRMPMPILMAMHPGNPHGLRFAEGDAGESGESQEQSSAATEGEQEGEQQQERTYTQSEVDKIIRKKAEALYKQRVGDVDLDDLKARAGTAKTAEERVADLERRYAQAETRALRSDIAAKFGIDAEDRDLFLTGNDEETLTAQAQRLADRDAERRRAGNTVRGEGTNPPPADDKDATARAFFGLS